MKVLHVVDAIDPSLGGGAAERTAQMALAQLRCGNDCTVLCTDYGLTEKRREELQGVDLVVVPTLCKRFLVPRITHSKLRALITESDIVHVIGHWSLLGAAACLMAERLGRPYVYCPAGSLLIYGRSALLKRAYNRFVGRKIVRGADRCIAITENEREHFHAYGVQDSSVSLLPNGVHPNRDLVTHPQGFRRRYGLGDSLLILFLGRLSPIKGPDLLLGAFARIASDLPATRLVFVGPDDELGAQLRDAADAEGLSERVMFTGYLAGEDKCDALAAADLLVIPSRHEAMSLVALEAGLLGTPVLLTDQCGFDEVEQVGGGRVVAANSDALSVALVDMLKNVEQLSSMGQALRDLVLSSYTWDALTQRVLVLYDQLISRRRVVSDTGPI